MNEHDCVTAGNIIDLLYIRDHCSMSKLTKSDVQLMIGFFYVSINNFLYSHFLYVFLFNMCMVITRS